MATQGDVYLCRVIEPNAYEKPAKGGRTVLAFVASGEESRAQYLAGLAADAWCDATGSSVDWHVETLPHVGSDENAVLRLARAAAKED